MGGYTVKNLMNTSVDDCKCSLQSVNDMGLLRELLAKCNQHGQKTRAALVSRRIRQLEKIEEVA